jgi:hypothetical protein
MHNEEHHIIYFSPSIISGQVNKDKMDKIFRINREKEIA